MGCAVLDSGCTSTVCGRIWFNSYLDTLSTNDIRQVTEHPSSKQFKFGDGRTFTSQKCANIPIFTGSQKSFLSVDIVECEIPLLLSNNSLKRANASLDFGSDEIVFLGEKVPVNISKSGHYFIRLSRDISSLSLDTHRILITSPIDPNNLTESRRIILKLHKQFAHPHPKRLKKLIQDSGISNQSVFDIVHEVSDKCEICKQFKKPLPRPIVAFPTATSFCEVIALDLKDILGFKILHMIDHATRYSSACVVANKKKETIVKGIMEHWIRLFGSPKYFLSDNGGEFINDELIEFSEQFNIFLKTTAAESPWSNGMCERHNEILADLVRKVQSENNCSFQIALHWALASKNALTSVYGFSPNQLVFGKNIELPTVHNNQLPADNSPSSDFIMKNLNALHSARRAFIQQESSERLRRALNRKTRGYSDHVFQQGDIVFYHRNNSKKWHGPAKVLGKDGQQHLLKHGGIYVRVHPCRMQLCDQPTGDSIVPSHELTSRPCQVPPAHSTDASTKSPILPSTQPDLTSNTHPIPDTSELSLDSVTRNESQTISNDSDSEYEYDEQNNYGPSEIIDYRVHQNDSDSEPGPSEIIDYRVHQNDSDSEPTNNKPCLALRRLQTYNNPGLTENSLLTITHDSCAVSSNHCNVPEDVLFGTETDNSRFDSAKREELKKWIDMETYEEVEDQGQPFLTCKWVCTEKVKGNVLISKARLVVRGFEEDTSQIQTDSPTCNKESVRILLAILAGNKWPLHSLDIKSAFLQGNTIQRDTYLKPPKIANTNKLWKLKKTPYGLSDAGRQWYIRVLKELSTLGAIQSKYDKATFIWYYETSTIGVMVLHVDDFLYGGTELFQTTILPRIREIFIVGLEESNSFRYLGLFISEHPDYIEMSTKGYASSCKEIPTSSLGADRDRKLSSTEITCLKQLSGQLNWVTTQSRPDLAFENCMIGNSINKASVRDVFNANRALRRLRDHDLSLFFPRLNLQACSLVGFCDASFANLPDSGSQGAFLIFLVDSNGLYCLIAWQSRRIRRVVHSTIAAECLSAVEVSETCTFLSKIIQELLSKVPQKIPIHILSDNKSLIDHLHSSTSVENKRLRIDIHVLRDMYHNNEIHEFKWIPTELQVANALTKKGCSSLYLTQILQGRSRFDFSSGAFVPLK